MREFGSSSFNAVHPRMRPTSAGEVLDTTGELIERGIDFCAVATPTSTHEVIGPELAGAGVAALIEKPLAHDSKAAQTMEEGLVTVRVAAALRESATTGRTVMAA